MLLLRRAEVHQWSIEDWRILKELRQIIFDIRYSILLFLATRRGETLPGRNYTSPIFDRTHVRSPALVLCNISLKQLSLVPFFNTHDIVQNQLLLFLYLFFIFGLGSFCNFFLLHLLLELFKLLKISLAGRSAHAVPLGEAVTHAVELALVDLA